MFTSNEQLNSAMKEILEIFQQGKDICTVFPKYPDELSADLVEAINTCVSKGYLTGVSCEVGSQGDVTVSTSKPHVTASGSKFILEN